MRVALMLPVAFFAMFFAASLSAAGAQDASAPSRDAAEIYPETERAELREDAARWDGLCPNWRDIDHDAQWGYVTERFEAARAASAIYADAAASICMAEYWLDHRFGNEQSYFFYLIAAEYGADTQEKARELRPTISEEQAQYLEGYARARAIEVRALIADE